MPMYAEGRRAWGDCMRCGLRYLLRELVLDGYYPNLRVCSGCYDPPQPQERLAIVSDPEALWKPSPDNYGITSPILGVIQEGNSFVLGWFGFNQNLQFESDDASGQGANPRGSSAGANITAGYIVYRAPVIAGVVGPFVQLANLVNTADEFGAFVIETNTYTDTPGAGSWAYQVLGYDVLFGDTFG